jgi:hypothetical protein
MLLREDLRAAADGPLNLDDVLTKALTNEKVAATNWPSLGAECKKQARFDVADYVAVS